MNGLTGVVQVLLYVPPGRMEPLKEFYENLLGEPPYYSWYENETDCGAKFRVGGSAIAVLCQAHPAELGPAAFNMECEDVDLFYARVRSLIPGQILSEPHTQPYGTRCFTIRDPAGNVVNIYMNGH